MNRQSRFLTRRSALLRLGGGFLALPGARSALAAAESLRTETATIANGPGGHLVQPAAVGRRPAILLLHDADGLTDGFRDIATRLAREDHLVLAIDLRGTAGTAIGDISLDVALAAARAAVAHLASRPDCTGRVGVIGFGWGAGVAGHLAVVEPTVDATVSYYGTQPLYHLRDEYMAMKSALLFHYAGRDAAINVGIETFKDELNVAKKPYTIHVYPGARRGFADPGKPGAFDAAASALAWQRTLKFLEVLRAD